MQKSRHTTKIFTSLTYIEDDRYTNSNELNQNPVVVYVEALVVVRLTILVGNEQAVHVQHSTS